MARTDSFDPCTRLSVHDNDLFLLASLPLTPFALEELIVLRRIGGVLSVDPMVSAILGKNFWQFGVENGSLWYISTLRWIGYWRTLIIYQLIIFDTYNTLVIQRLHGRLTLTKLTEDARALFRRHTHPYMHTLFIDSLQDVAIIIKIDNADLTPCGSQFTL